jgi:hypothetical protein
MAELTAIPGIGPWTVQGALIIALQRDMGTGEGGVLASLAPLPKLTVAYEEWWPTVPAAHATLRPLGVHLVVTLGSTDNVPKSGQEARPSLPFRAEAFDVVLNRHEAFDPVDVLRIVKEGGRFLTEQVASDEAASVRGLLGPACR